MELLVILGGFVLLAVLALNFGFDSREGMQSNEQQLARFGMTWGHAIPVPIRVVRRSWRRRLARVLYAIARWLNPELNRARA
jgi:hypothetical protein